MEPGPWSEMIKLVRELEAALGKHEKQIEDNEMNTVIVQRRSIRAKTSLKSGHVLTDSDLVMLRPCENSDLPPYCASEIIGKKLNTDLLEGESIKLKNVSFN